METVVYAGELCKRFRGAAVLDDLNLEVAEGSVYGIVGSNGAGKTTTIRILMNILRADSGRTALLGVDSRRLGPAQFAQIGHVSENQQMPDWMTVERLFRYLKPFYPTWDDARAAELLGQFDLPPRRKLKHLSRGMWMKTALASSLAYRPRLLVLDEPFGGLDPLVRDELVEGLLDSAGATTILISSHDLAEMETFATHIGYLDRGRLQFSEELSSLAARFREVEVTIDGAAALPADGRWPVHWLRPEAGAALVRFVDTRFDAEETAGEIRRIFDRVRDISARPMPLRAIFVTLARSTSRPAAEVRR